MGFTSFKAFCPAMLGRTYRAVCYMMAGGNRGNQKRKSGEIISPTRKQMEIARKMVAVLLDEDWAERDLVKRLESLAAEFRKLDAEVTAKQASTDAETAKSRGKRPESPKNGEAVDPNGAGAVKTHDDIGSALRTFLASAVTAQTGSPVTGRKGLHLLAGSGGR